MGYVLFAKLGKYCWRHLANDTVQIVTAQFKINRTEKCFRQNDELDF